MSEIKDGGPAFPVSDPFKFDPKDLNEMKRLAGGMTLRDYFAAQALPRFISHDRNRLPISKPDEAARQAYQYADTMLKVREQS